MSSDESCTYPLPSAEIAALPKPALSLIALRNVLLPVIFCVLSVNHSLPPEFDMLVATMLSLGKLAEVFTIRAGVVSCVEHTVLLENVLAPEILCVPVVSHSRPPAFIMLVAEMLSLGKLAEVLTISAGVVS